MTTGLNETKNTIMWEDHINQGKETRAEGRM